MKDRLPKTSSYLLKYCIGKLILWRQQSSETIIYKTIMSLFGNLFDMISQGTFVEDEFWSLSQDHNFYASRLVS
jgi:hypothetical protein